MITRKVRGSISAAFLVFILVTPAAARDADTWPVKERIVGKDGDKSEDVSGIACAKDHGFPRACLVIDDNLQEAQFVTVEDGVITAGDTVQLIDNEFKNKPLELDGEGVAFADGAYYVMGSHGHPRDKDKKLDPSKDLDKINARIDASSQIVRIRMGSGGSVSLIERTGKLRDIIKAEPALTRFVDRRLENNGVTIEGIALSQGHVLAGFRSPTLQNGRAAVLSVPIDALFGDGTAEHTLYKLPLGNGQGVRDLAPLNDGFLVLAGPSADGGGAYSVFWWDGKTENVSFLKDISEVTGGDPKHKPEAILPLDVGPSGVRVLVMSDGEKEGAPVALDVPAP